MKKQLWVFLIVILMTSSSAFGSSLKKMYLDVDQILFEASGIYIEVNNCYYKVGAIALDKEKNRYYALTIPRIETATGVVGLGSTIIRSGSL